MDARRNRLTLHSRAAVSSALESSGRAITRAKQWRRVGWPGHVGSSFGRRSSRNTVVIARDGNQRGREVAGCCSGVSNAPAAAVRAPTSQQQQGSNLAATLFAARRPERAGENTPCHAFPPSSSGFFGNLFGTARLCVPDIGYRQGPSLPRWVPPPPSRKPRSGMTEQVQMVLVDPSPMYSACQFSTEALMIRINALLL